MQEEEIKMTINLPYIEGISKELRRILRSHKIRSTFYTESTLRKMICKPKGRNNKNNKNNSVYKTDCSNCESNLIGL